MTNPIFSFAWTQLKSNYIFLFANDCYHLMHCMDAIFSYYKYYFFAHLDELMMEVFEAKKNENTNYVWHLNTTENKNAEKFTKTVKKKNSKNLNFVFLSKTIVNIDSSHSLNDHAFWVIFFSFKFNSTTNYSCFIIIYELGTEYNEYGILHVQAYIVLYKFYA